MVRWAIVLALVLPALASANGGPVMWSYTSATPAGGVVPVDEARIRLISEELRIVLLPDGRRYRASARYRLANPEGPRKVTFGVPLSWVVSGRTDAQGELGARSDASWAASYAEAAAEFGFEGGADGDMLGLEDPSPVTPRARASTGLVHIRVGGRRFPCRIAREAMVPYVREMHHNARAWCVAEVEIPKGSDVGLSLDYLGGLGHLDRTPGDGASRLDAEIGRRRLDYELFPAGFWRGSVARFRATIDLGPYVGLAEVVRPAGAVAVGGHVTFDLRNPDLKALERIVLDLDATAVVRQRLLLGPDFPGKPHVEASSVLVGQGNRRYGPEQVVDRAPGTAWCEGVPGGGVGEWIALRYERPFVPQGDCRFRGYTLVPGYARSERAYRENGRVRAFRLSECDRPENGRGVRLEPARSAEGAAVLVPRLDDDPMVDDGSASGRAPCVRLTITEVEEGTTGDTCIAEFFPVIDCGHWPLDPSIFPEPADLEAAPANPAARPGTVRP
jgi:hypothetical protein